MNFKSISSCSLAVIGLKMIMTRCDLQNSASASAPAPAPAENPKVMMSCDSDYAIFPAHCNFRNGCPITFDGFELALYSFPQNQNQCGCSNSQTLNHAFPILPPYFTNSIWKIEWGFFFRLCPPVPTSWPSISLYFRACLSIKIIYLLR